MLVVGVVGWAVSRRGLALRHPTDSEVRDFTEPIGRIAARHLDVSMFSPDLADVTAATAAAGTYVMSGPIYRAGDAAGAYAPYDPDDEPEHP
jgi:hypothetical protein